MDITKIRTKEWNKFRISLGEAHFTRSELSSLARMEKLSYYATMPNRLIEKGNLIFVGKKIFNKNQEANVYKFTGEPIHWSVIKGAGKKRQSKKTPKLYSSKENKFTEQASTDMKLDDVNQHPYSDVNIETNISKDIDLGQKRLQDLWSKLQSHLSYKFKIPETVQVALSFCRLNYTLDLECQSFMDFEDITQSSEAKNAINYFTRFLKGAGIKVQFSYNEEVHPAEEDIKGYSNVELVEELRKRGVEVKAHQIIEL